MYEYMQLWTLVFYEKQNDKVVFFKLRCKNGWQRHSKNTALCCSVREASTVHQNECTVSVLVNVSQHNG